MKNDPYTTQSMESVVGDVEGAVHRDLTVVRDALPGK
jgi:hypothetical protein